MLDILDEKICNVNEVKNILTNYLNKPLKIKCDLGRNKYEIYHVIITDLYNCVFIVKLLNESCMTKSFSYVDIITKTIKIYE